MIPEETVEKVLTSTDIVELIQSYFPLRKMGTDYVALCPFHNEKTPSFSVSPSKQMYYCFGCGAGGGAARFLMEYETLDFPTAVKRLAERVGIRIVEEELSPELAGKYRQRQDLLQLHQEAAQWFHRNLLKKPFAEEARAYLKKRGLDIEVARDWRLGYAPGDSKVWWEWARQRGYAERLLVDGGLMAQREGPTGMRTGPRFRNRLMFPVCNDFGEVIAFSGRTLEADANVAKYLNSPETSLFQKSKTLFGLHRSKRPIHKQGRAVVCEGQIDLITCFAHGIENIVAPLGTAFTSDHARILKRHTQEVVICFDADAAGFKAAQRTFKALAESNVFVRAVEMPDGEDPDSFIRKHGAERYRKILEDAQDFLEFHIDHRSKRTDLSSPKAIHELTSELAENVALVTDKLMQDSIINTISIRLGVTSEEFRRRVLREGRKRRNWQERDRARSQSGSESQVEEWSFQDGWVQLLCQVLLIDESAKQWFENVVNNVDHLKYIPDSELLELVGKGRFSPGDSVSVLSFLASCPPAQERVLSKLVMKPPEGDHLEAAKSAWRHLESGYWRQQLQEKEAQLKKTDVDFDVKLALLQEIKAIKEKLDRPEVGSDGSPLSA